MLPNHLRSVPPPKVVIVKDNITDRGYRLTQFLVQQAASVPQQPIFVFRFSYDKHDVLPTELARNRVQEYNYQSDCLNWLSSDNSSARPELETVVQKAADAKAVVVMDDLSHFVLLHGMQAAYRLLHSIKVNNNIKQLICLAHCDLREGDDFVNYLNELAVLSIQLEPHSNAEQKLLSYVYKKPSGKVVREREFYNFKEGKLVCQAYSLSHLKDAISNEIASDQILPENLSSFKISLSDSEKLARENVVLPYLPKQESGLVINYTMDDADDWDEEDPDDDLDI